MARPGPLALAALVIGGALACGGASALNHVLDRDIDRLMGPRTASRPVAAGRIAPAHAVAFAFVLLVLSFIVLTALDNLLTAALSLSGAAFYVVVYTLLLKRNTEQNIVIGGAAGAIPPLAGWAAAHGTLGLGAVVLFAIVLLWTPPHFWALALLIAPGYKAAGVPMMPVTRGPRATATPGPLVLGRPRRGDARAWPAGHLRSRSTSPAAALLGIGLCVLAWRLSRNPSAAAVLFHYSLLYLALLFVAVAADAAIR